jgi:hypothetical protein
VVEDGPADFSAVDVVGFGAFAGGAVPEVDTYLAGDGGVRLGFGEAGRF